MGELANNIEGIGNVYEQSLNSAGVFTLGNLRGMDIFSTDAETHLGLARLASWQSMAILQQVDGIDKQYSEALIKCDITDLNGLEATDPQAVIRCLNGLESQGVIPQSPVIDEVAAWKNTASTLLDHLYIGRVKLAPEVGLVWETMTCRGMRSFYDTEEHPCHWFNQYGPYHSYDVKSEDSLQSPEGYLTAVYAGERFQVPELLSGCRKAPIMSVGLNPNLRAESQSRRIYPYFDDIQQYAKHFRFRTNFKYSIDRQYYDSKINNGENESLFEMGETIPLHKEYVSMYNEYKKILNAFETRIGVSHSELSLAEDVSYYNFVTCHSPRWDMDDETEEGIVNECFYNRKFFIRQLRQSGPNVVIVFSKPVMEKFVEVFKNDFDLANIPDPTQSYAAILDNNEYEMSMDEKRIRVIFSPHPTGARYWYGLYDAHNKIVDALVEEYNAGNLQYDEKLQHLNRSKGPCSFCNNAVFKIGNCPYL